LQVNPPRERPKACSRVPLLRRQPRHDREPSSKPGCGGSCWPSPRGPACQAARLCGVAPADRKSGASQRRARIDGGRDQLLAAMRRNPMIIGLRSEADPCGKATRLVMPPAPARSSSSSTPCCETKSSDDTHMPLDFQHGCFAPLRMTMESICTIALRLCSE
jgi:hypothetical protein